MGTAPTDTGPWTVARLLAWTRDYFERSAVESPRLCAEILLANALGCERIHLFTRYETTPDEKMLAVFRQHVREAGAGRPIAHLIGRKEFFSLVFEVTPDTLIPRPETEIIVERVVSMARRDGVAADTILDIGTGGGCIAVSLAKHLPQARVFASDVSEGALAAARRNAERHGVADRVEFRSGDLTAPWSDMAGAFDVVVSNPPYVAERDRDSLAKTVRDYEPAQALFAGADGLDVLRRLATEAAPLLKPGGRLLLEMGYDQAEAVRGLLRDAGWCDIVTYRDAGGHERVAHARR